MARQRRDQLVPFSFHRFVMNHLSPEDRLAAAGWILPPSMPPSENYLSYRIEGPMLYLSGHGPRRSDGSYICGQLKTSDDVEQGYLAAAQVALNLLATIKSATGDLGKVSAFLKVLGMVNASPEFVHHPKVVNGFSDVVIQAFGDAGRHARSAVGMSSLPHGMMVEVEAIVLLNSSSLGGAAP